MAGALKLFVNLSANDAADALVQGFFARNVAETIRYRRDDIRTVELHFLEEDFSDTQRPFRYVDPAAWPSVKFAAGTADLAPTGGTFTITDTDLLQTTAAIAYNATGTTIQAAMRLALMQYANCLVTGAAGGPWEIDRVDLTAVADLTLTTTGLNPQGSTGFVINTEDGTASRSEKFQIGLTRAHPMLKTSGWSALPAAAVAVATQQSGSAIAPKKNKIFRVTFNADAHGGAVSLLFTGDTTAGTVTFRYNATEAEVLAAFEAHTDVEDDGVSVVRNGPGDISIELVGAGIKESDTPTLATSSNTLQVPLGLTAAVSANTSLVTTLLGTADEAAVKTEIEIARTSGQPETVANVVSYLTRDLIRNTPGSSTGLESWVTTNEVPQGTAWIRHEDGTVTAFFSSADTNAARGTALQAAKSAAVSGETIFVGPGDADTRDLFKTGVNWHFFPGARVIYTGSADAAVWDNTATGVATAVTCKVTGHGSFKHAGSHATGQLVSTVAINVAASSIHFECSEILHSPSSSSNQSSAVRVHGGTVFMRCPYVESTIGQGVWWSDGEMFFHGQDIVGATTAIYSGVDALPLSADPWVSGYFWCKVNRAKSTAGQGAQLAGAANARSWLEADEIIGNSASAALLMGVGRNYAIVKKVTQSGAGAGVQLLSGENWLTVQKVTGGTGANGFAFTCNSGSSWVDCLQIAPTAGSATAMIRVSGGTNHFRLADSTTVSTTMNGVQISAGTLRLDGARIDATASTAANPVLISGGTLQLKGVSLIAQGARDSIEAATAQTVLCMNSVANNAPDAVNVTCSGTGLFVDSAIA